MSKELPQGWAFTKIGELFEFKYGKSLPQENRNSNGSLNVYGSNGVVGLHESAVSIGPTIVIGRKGSVGEVHLSPQPCWPIDTTYFIDEFPCDLPSKFWALYLKSLRLGQRENSSAIPGISRKDIYEVEAPIPPLTEQRRILVKLEALLAKVAACRQRLEKIPSLLKRFRQSVLVAACSGRLTADWREDNSYEEDLPPEWRRMSLEELLTPNGIFDGPFGSNLKTSDYTESGVRVIRLENVGHLRFIGEKETFISREKYEYLKKHTVKEGDIIFASFIDEEIRACLVPKLKTTAIAKADCFCLRPDIKLANRQYLTYQLVSLGSYNKLIKNVHGATRPRINTSQLRKLRIKICPLLEQQEIVHRVEGLFRIADRIEERYQRAKTQVDMLTQSILAKAFSGELVPQDPNDEPASVLLERIRHQKNLGDQPKKKRRGEQRITRNLPLL